MDEPTPYVKCGFCREDMKKIDRLVEKGFGMSRADLVRRATLEYLSQTGDM